MTDLFPAAQAVFDAAFEELDYVPERHVKWCIAAALRAAADQVVPEPNEQDKELFSIAALRLRWVMRDQILAIAAELNGDEP
jgi:glycine/D-amino acid oxidase-like deaminating enzyme